MQTSKLFKLIQIDITKETLLDVYENYKLTHSTPVKDYYKPIEGSENTIFTFPPINEFVTLNKLPFIPDEVRFVLYQSSNLFIHKDRSMKSRIGIVVSGIGDLVFYDDSKHEIARTDLQQWTLFNTQCWHDVPKAEYRLSLQMGFKQDFNVLSEKINEFI